MNLGIGSGPILRAKQHELDIQDVCGLLRIHWQIGPFNLHSAFYTRVDQAFLLWGTISFVIFAVAHFFPISWSLQAYVWSALTIAGTIAMTNLTQFWARVEQLSWVVYGWGILMVAGVVLTDLGIFLGWGNILSNLCPMWLALVALGYFITGIGLQSRSFLFIAGIHALGLAVLPNVISWQFLFTGIVMGGCLMLLSQMQWDMRPPIESPVLTETERVFNREQHRRRQSLS